MTATLIFGGTFDPVHFGHVLSARALGECFDDARVVMIPCQVPPHRSQPAVKARHRLKMLELAVAEEPMITVDDCELKREGKSFTFDTLSMYRAQLPDTPLCFVLGNDSWVTLTTWYRWRELINLAHLVVLARPGETVAESDELQDWAAGRLAEPDVISRQAGSVVKLTLEQFDISATNVRKALSEGQSVSDYVPADVINYITENQLYRNTHDRT